MDPSEWHPPNGLTPARRPRTRRYVVAGLAVAALAAASPFVPIPMFYGYFPGPVRDVEPLVRVDGADTYSSEGSLLLTTISVDTEVTLVEWLGTAFDDARDIVLKDQVTGGRPLDVVREQQAQEMQMSKRNAQEVALEALGLGRAVGDGARVLSTLPGFPAAGVLQAGDVLVAIDGREVETMCDVERVIEARAAGDVVRVSVRRAGRIEVFDITSVQAPGNSDAAFIGIRMRDAAYRFESEVSVDFETGRIAGPSAGLLLSLALYDRLTPGDVTGGRRIAGTGTIGCGGAVGPIGGIQQKVAAAEKKGAEIFLAPVANAPDAERVADTIRIVPVATFAQALSSLEDSTR